MKRILYLFFAGFLALSISSCSSDDDTPSNPTPEDNNSEQDPGDGDNGGNNDDGGTTASFFEGIVNLVDADEELEFNATGENAEAFIGDFPTDDGNLPDVLFMAFKEDESDQQLSFLGAPVTEEGTYTMGEGGFDLAALFSTYDSDTEDSSAETLYTFHDYSVEFEGKIYQTEFTVEITGLSEDRIQGNLTIEMYSYVFEYEGEGDDKELVDGYIHKGTVEGEFDVELVDPDDLNVD